MTTQSFLSALKLLNSRRLRSFICKTSANFTSHSTLYLSLYASHWKIRGWFYGPINWSTVTNPHRKFHMEKSAHSTFRVRSAAHHTRTSYAMELLSLQWHSALQKLQGILIGSGVGGWGDRPTIPSALMSAKTLISGTVGCSCF
jgi:hypothetical protein